MLSKGGALLHTIGANGTYNPHGVVYNPLEHRAFHAQGVSVDGNERVFVAGAGSCVMMSDSPQ